MRTRVQRHLTEETHHLHRATAGSHPGPSGPHARSSTARRLAPPQTLAPDHLALSKPTELTWHDYLVMLLHVGAEIEHSLMVQYLFAAYSLGGEQVPSANRDMVTRWRNIILTVAKEEMGHLLTVQNLLRLLGGPLSLDREDYPFDSPFYPYPFKLERLSLRSLSCYIYAEMPEDMNATGGRYDQFRQEDQARIVEQVEKVAAAAKAQAHKVDEIYEAIIHIVSDPARIPDSAFNADSYDEQASWDEWGRQYGPSVAGSDPAGFDRRARHSTARYPARVILQQMGTRTQAVAALRDIAGQGEAAHLGDPSDEPSHFDRFIEVYQEFEAHVGSGEGRWQPTREVVDNPSTVHPSNGRPGGSYIENVTTHAWASLFNLRYRMLLTYLSHAYRLPTGSAAGTPGARTGVLHRTFTEMYNLKTIAGMLVRMPLTDDPQDVRRAGPPFEMPYTLTLPLAEADCWRLHRDLLAGSVALCETMRAAAPPDGQAYLASLLDLDRQSIAWIDTLLGGTGSRRGRV
jgi:hypothetical protein